MDSKSDFRHLFPTGIKDQADVSMQSGRTGTASQGPKVTFCFLNMGPEPFLSSSSNIQREMPELSKAPNLCWMTSLLWLQYIIPTFREIFLWISWLCDFSLMWLFPEHLWIHFAVCLGFFEWCKISYPILKISSGTPGRKKKKILQFCQ